MPKGLDIRGYSLFKRVSSFFSKSSKMYSEDNYLRMW